MVWKMPVVAERSFRRLRAPRLMTDVHLGVQHADGLLAVFMD